MRRIATLIVALSIVTLAVALAAQSAAPGVQAPSVPGGVPGAPVPGGRAGAPPRDSAQQTPTGTGRIRGRVLAAGQRFDRRKPT